MYKFLFNISRETNLTYQNARNVNSVHFALIEDQEDHLAPSYSIVSEHLNDTEDYEEAWQKGLTISMLYNGATRLVYFAPLQTVSIYEDICITEMFLVEGAYYPNLTKNNYFQLPPAYPFNKNHTFNQLKKDNESKDIIVDLFNLASSTEDVYGLILQFGVSLSWINLYSILDTIKFLSGDLKKLVALTNYSQKDIELFTRTANNFGHLSFLSRHGQQGWDGPKSTMSLPTAQNIILSLTRAFFIERYALNFK